MCSLRPLAIIASFLIVSVSIPQSLFSQMPPKPSPTKQRAQGRRQSRRSQRAETLSSAINELLKLDPLSPESADEKRTDNAGDSTEEINKPPADDAPIKELIIHWFQDHDANAAKPSDKVRERLLEACEARPELIVGLINFLPETADAHDRLYKLFDEESPNDSNWKPFLRNWLVSNSRYFRDDLIAEARGDGANGPPSGDSLRSLAELDWETARPIVETFASSGNVQMAQVALSLLYERAQRGGDSTGAEKYRALLKAIVADGQAPDETREKSIASLLKTEWNGQQEWFVSLFSDPTLTGVNEDAGKDPAAPVNGRKAPPGTLSLSGDQIISRTRSEVLTDPGVENLFGENYVLRGHSDIVIYDHFIEHSSLSVALNENAEKWLPVISNLIGHNQQAIHNAAVKYLAEFMNQESTDKKWKKEIAQKLAPCLTDPKWAAAAYRADFIQSLVDLQAPELLSGLIWVLEHDENEHNRAAAAEAVTQYRDPRAIPPLRRALEKEDDEERRGKIVAALAECGGFSDDEMAAAIEAYATVDVSYKSGKEIHYAQIGGSDESLPLKVGIGRILTDSKTFHATESLAIRLFERAKALRASQPEVARRILRSVEDVPLRVAEINLVERIGDGWADVDALKLALERRDSIRKSAGDELYSLIKQGGYAAGVAATILDDEREQREALRGTDAKAHLALLAGARYLRDKLPVELVGEILASPDRALARAAESYLEVEDSAEARKLVMARHRNEAYILGDMTEIGHGTLERWEEAMRKEIKGGDGLETIYALVTPNSNRDFNGVVGVVIRVRDGKAEISSYETEGRRNVRSLTEGEFEELRSFTSRQEVEDLGTESYDDNTGAMRFEYLRLTKDGGRRIVLDGFRRAPKNPTLHEELSGLFYRLSRSGDFTARYAIEDKIPDVEVLLADKKQEAQMVCGEGREIRVLIGEQGAEYKRGLAEASPEWREFSSGKAGVVTDEPLACSVKGMISSAMKNKWNGQSREIGFPTRSGGGWVYNSYGKDSGVWRWAPGAEPERIVSGPYFFPIVTPDGKWLVALKRKDEGEESPLRLVRRNLQTGKEFPIEITNVAELAPVSYIEAHGKVLLAYRGLFDPNMAMLMYLLDADAGTVQKLKGEIRPLMETFARELQPTGNPNEFWAAAPDINKRATSLGRYDARKFVFTPLVELPGLILRNNDFWVDKASGKIWFTYNGHLLRIPLPTKTK